MRSQAKAPSAGATRRRILLAISAVLTLVLVLGVSVANALAPTVSVENATDVSHTTAKAKGEVNPEGKDTSYRFEYTSQAQFEAEGFDNAAQAGHGSLGEAEPETTVETTLEWLTPNTTYHLRLVAENEEGSDIAVASSTFETLAVAKPTVTLDPITHFDAESASFEAQINPNAPESAPVTDPDVETAFATEYRFECTPECPNTPGTQTIPADDGPNAVSFDASGLEPSTEYTIKLFASNRGGEEVAEQSFTTTTLAPTAITHLVANLLSDSARLTGFLDPQNEPTTYFFQWGKASDLSDAQSLPASEDASAGSGGEQVAVGEDLANLAPNTTYYYRLVSDNPTGPPSVGEIESFTTRETPPPMGDGVGAFGDRVIELVSSADPNMGPVLGGIMSTDGDRVLYRVSGGTDQSSWGTMGNALAERTAAGWTHEPALPDRSRIPYPRAEAWSVSPDLSRVAIRASERFGEAYEPWTHYTYEPATSELEKGFSGPALSIPQVYAFSDDLSHHFGTAGMPFAPEDTAPGGGLYDFGSGSPELIGLLPDGSAPSCGVSPRGAGEFYGGNANVSSHWNSIDGNRVYFLTRGSGDCSANPQNLYMREGGAVGETTAISSAPLPGPDAGARFEGATPDGSRAFFTTTNRLDPDDANESSDIYRFTVGAGVECITCTPAEPAVEPQLMALAEHGERVYFASSRALAPGARAGVPSVYLWRASAPGVFSFISPVNTLSATDTPDGAGFVFVSDRPEMNALTGTDNSGLAQLYRYHDRERSLVCLTCPADGPATIGHAAVADIAQSFSESGVERGGMASDDGKSYFFATPAALAPEDADASVDFYEWREGRIGLVSERPGSQGLGGLQGLGVVADGSDFFFLSQRPLLPGADGLSLQIYDARIGGGFPEPVPPTPCEGDGCHGAPTPAPGIGAAGSAQFSGPGNPRSKSRCAKGKVRKRGSCVKKPRKQKARKHSKNKANANRGGGK